MKSRMDLRQVPQSMVLLHSYQPQQTQASKLVAAWRQFWRRGSTAFRISHDPTIWQTIDPGGTVWWHAYHPITGRCATRESELEILAWIDQGR